MLENSSLSALMNLRNRGQGRYHSNSYSWNSYSPSSYSWNSYSPSSYSWNSYSPSSYSWNSYSPSSYSWNSYSPSSYSWNSYSPSSYSWNSYSPSSYSWNSYSPSSYSWNSYSPRSYTWNYSLNQLSSNSDYQQHASNPYDYVSEYQNNDNYEYNPYHGFEPRQSLKNLIARNSQWEPMVEQETEQAPEQPSLVNLIFA